MNKFNVIKRVPISIVWLIIMIISFTFVNYEWITTSAGRFSFVLITFSGGLIATAANSDLNFWKYEK